MEEKKEIKVKLSTVVFLFIIFILMIALGVTYYLGFIKDKEDITNTIKTNTESANIVLKNDTNNKVQETKTFSSGKYFLQPDKNLLDDEYFETAYVKDEYIEFKEDGTFYAYLGWGKLISGEYKKEDYIINCDANILSLDSLPDQQIIASISFKIIDMDKIEIIKTSEKFKMRTGDYINYSLNDEETDMSLYPFVKGIKFEKDTDIEYSEITDDLDKNEMLGVIKIENNLDGTYTIYGGVYEIKNPSMAEFSSKFKKITVQENTKCKISYWNKEISFKEWYEDSNMKNGENELPLILYPHGLMSLRFEFSESKCILVETVDLES